MNILYLVHDTNDAAVHKRVKMLQNAGAHVQLAGFQRHTKTNNAGSAADTPIVFGTTYNARLYHRLFLLLRTAVAILKYRFLFKKADVILCRNLEMLVLAKWASLIFKQSIKTHYELLDIHRLLFHTGLAGKSLRYIEAYAAQNIQSVLISSKAFEDEYLKTRSNVKAPAYLIENKIYPTPDENLHIEKTLQEPWIIGLFGMLRCRQSISMLMTLAQKFPQKVRIHLAGKPAYDALPEFDHWIDNTENVTYLGPYKNPDDLYKIYGQVHFNWVIDFYEDGLNSNLLLPNRLYEGSVYGAIPIARTDTHTAQWLMDHKAGIILESPLENTLHDFFEKLDVPNYQKLQSDLKKLPQNLWKADDTDCKALYDHLKKDKNV